MAALGELLLLGIYFLLGLSAIYFFVLTLKKTNSYKLFTFFGCILSCFLLFSYKSCSDKVYNESQLDKVGFYYLSTYPNCKDCILELKEDNTYEVRKDGKIIEKSNWHYESGGDYWITWLDNDKHQLGSGSYEYGRYKLKYSR